jgi:hypothetical protein
MYCLVLLHPLFASCWVHFFKSAAQISNLHHPLLNYCPHIVADCALCAVPSALLQIGETICSPEAPVALPTIQVEEPTVSMTFKVGGLSVQHSRLHICLRTCLLGYGSFMSDVIDHDAITQESAVG